MVTSKSSPPPRPWPGLGNRCLVYEFRFSIFHFRFSSSVLALGPHLRSRHLMPYLNSLPNVYGFRGFCGFCGRLFSLCFQGIGGKNRSACPELRRRERSRMGDSCLPCLPRGIRGKPVEGRLFIFPDKSTA